LANKNYCGFFPYYSPFISYILLLPAGWVNLEVINGRAEK
jgi:hypothetical protein